MLKGYRREVFEFFENCGMSLKVMVASLGSKWCPMINRFDSGLLRTNSSIIFLTIRWRVIWNKAHFIHNFLGFWQILERVTFHCLGTGVFFFKTAIVNAERFDFCHIPCYDDSWSKKPITKPEMIWNWHWPPWTITFVIRTWKKSIIILLLNLNLQFFSTQLGTEWVVGIVLSPQIIRRSLAVNVLHGYAAAWRFSSNKRGP